MKKLLSFAALATTVVTLTACNNEDSNSKTLEFENDQLLASSVYTIGGIIDNVESTSTTRLARTALTSTQYKQVSDSVKYYVDSVDKLISGSLDNHFSNETSLTIENIENYSDVYQLTLSDSTYVLAYNKVDINTEQDDDGSESTANLAGKMYQVIDDVVTNEYELVGYEETEEDEEEVETEFFIKATDSEGNYIKYEYKSEIETDEVSSESDAKIELKSDINGIKTESETEIEYDSEDGYQVKITDKIKDETGTYESEYEYFRSIDGEFEITFKYDGEDFDAEGTVEVTEVDGVYTYTFIDDNEQEYKFEEEDHL